MSANIHQKHMYQVWNKARRAQGGLMSSRSYEHLQFGLSIQFIGWWSLFLALFLDIKLLLPDFGDPPSARHFGIVFLSLLPACMVNGWIVDHQMAIETPRNHQRPLWLRLLRWAAASILPASSLITPPIWRRIQGLAWAQAGQRKPSPLSLRKSFRTLPSPPLAFRLFDSPLRQYLEVLSILPPLAAVGALWNSDSELTLELALILSILIHVIAFAAAPILVEPLIRRAQGSASGHFIRHFRWLTLLSSLWIFPLAFILLYQIGTDRLLVNSAYTDRNQARRQTSWRALENELQVNSTAVPLRTFWSLPKALHTEDDFGRITEERRVLFRFKTAFLIPETGILFWIGASQTELFSTHDQVIIPIFVGAFTLALISAFLWFFPSLAYALRWARTAKASTPYLRGGYLFLPTAAFLIGCGGGLLAAQGGHHGDFPFLSGSILFLWLLLLLRFMDRFIRARGDLSLDDFDSLWLLGVLLITLGIFKVMLPTLPEWTGLYLALSAPFLGLLTGILCCPSLLHPFYTRHLISYHLPLRFRAVLWIMVATALLPLGGLAVPFWIWARHRLWPRYECFGENG